MSDLNNVSLTGRLTKDPVSKTLPTGTFLAEFAVANNTGFGQYAKTNYFDVKLWGKQGQAVFPYLSKGKHVAVSGSLEMETWFDKDGNNCKKWVLTAQQVILLSSASDAVNKIKAAAKAEALFSGSPEVSEEDIPF
jgi:single-strand DNA-binding protein